VAREGGVDLRLETLSEGRAVVHVDGELDLATVPELEKLLADLDLGERLVIDLSPCTFLDSSAIRVLVTTIRDADERGGTVTLVAPDPGVARVLEIASVDLMTTVHPTLDAALQPYTEP
jgi:anti-sigma B factor antagonist